uniref:Integrase n=1 Tax=Mirabilis jalapa TaxID=3538 RepID=A0A1B3TNU9_MIRJA|nr:integrase [Mirabilis jalapa]AOW44033.1 integrase [Mirabilis jalapa]
MVEIPNSFCHSCQLGKHVRLPFETSMKRTLVPFHIIHSDLWTSPVSSCSGYKYYLLFLDDFTHYLWVFPLRAKSEVYAKFVQFHVYVRTQFSLPIKILQCDNGREYYNTPLKLFLSQNGIIFQTSCLYTSQPNGKAERTIRTINNTLRTLLIQSNLPPSFWVESLIMSAHLFNITPTTTLGKRVPHELLFGSLPTYDHLRIFGCLCYPNLTPMISHKLEPRSTPCVFLGYPPTQKGYCCFDLENKKIITSRHVTFDETVFPYPLLSPMSAYDFLLDDAPTPYVTHFMQEHNRAGATTAITAASPAAASTPAAPITASPPSTSTASPVLHPQRPCILPNTSPKLTLKTIPPLPLTKLSPIHNLNTYILW